MRAWVEKGDSLSLLRSQGDDRVGIHGAAGGPESPKRTDNQERAGGHHERQWVTWGNTEEDMRDQPGGRQRAWHSDDDSRGGQEQCLAQYQPQDALAL